MVWLLTGYPRPPESAGFAPTSCRSRVLEVARRADGTAIIGDRTWTGTGYNQGGAFGRMTHMVRGVGVLGFRGGVRGSEARRAKVPHAGDGYSKSTPVRITSIPGRTYTEPSASRGELRGEGNDRGEMAGIRSCLRR